MLQTFVTPVEFGDVDHSSGGRQFHLRGSIELGRGGKQLDERTGANALARPTLADQSEYLSFAHVKVDPIHRADVAVFGAEGDAKITDPHELLAGSGHDDSW